MGAVASADGTLFPGTVWIPAGPVAENPLWKFTSTFDPSTMSNAEKAPFATTVLPRDSVPCGTNKSACIVVCGRIDAVGIPG
jgi:hypothetical protein